MLLWLLLFSGVLIADAAHFNGGTIRWAPVNPYDNSSSISISIIQTYYWTYPNIMCAMNVPITSPGRASANANLTCVVDCSTDGGYSIKPVNILTDCVSASSGTGIMVSERSANVTLAAGAHFYVAYLGSAWRALGSPSASGLQWSIVSLIDLRVRPDGFINTPPTVTVVSPQYVIVNQTSQIPIPVSDANTGDDVRCRWSEFISGYRRRKRSNYPNYGDREGIVAQVYEKTIQQNDMNLVRNKRAHGNLCQNPGSLCQINTPCNCSVCLGTNCNGSTCQFTPCTKIGSTTIDTPGTLLSTSSYPIRQAIDECGGICHEKSVSNDTTLSNCTLSFRGLVPNTWYAIAIQVEDFIDRASFTPMSSVPVQFLIYVMPEPYCSNPAVILPLNGCLEAPVGITSTFTLTVLNMCDPNVTSISDLLVLKSIVGMQEGNLTTSSVNQSLVSVNFTWTPQLNQIGPQQLCTVAYTDENVQSTEYCVTFIVISSSIPCMTTTTTSTETTSTLTTSSSTSTSSSTTSTTKTTTSTSTSSSSSSTSTTTTSTGTTSTSTTSSSTSTSSTSTSTSSTSSSTSTSTSTTSTSSTTTSVTTATNAATATSTSASKKQPNWGLIAGLSSLALPLALCTACCFYHFLWNPSEKRRKQDEEEETGRARQTDYASLNTELTSQSTSEISIGVQSEVSDTTQQAYNSDSRGSLGEGSLLVMMYNAAEAKRARTNSILSTARPSRQGSQLLGLLKGSSVNRVSSISGADETSNREYRRASQTSAMENQPSSGLQSIAEQSSVSAPSPGTEGHLDDFTRWSRLYLFGTKQPSMDSDQQEAT